MVWQIWLTSIILSILALVCFEHLITFKYEIDFLRKRKWSTAIWIFFINRYQLIATVVVSVTPSSAQVGSSSYLQIIVADLCRCKCPSNHDTLRLYSQARPAVITHEPWTLWTFSLMESSRRFLFTVCCKFDFEACGFSHTDAQYFRFYAPSHYCKTTRGDFQWHGS